MILSWTVRPLTVALGFWLVIASVDLRTPAVASGIGRLLLEAGAGKVRGVLL